MDGAALVSLYQEAARRSRECEAAFFPARALEVFCLCVRAVGSPRRRAAGPALRYAVGFRPDPLPPRYKVLIYTLPRPRKNARITLLDHPPR